MSFFKLHDDSLLASVDIGSYEIRCAVFQKSDQLPLKILSWAEQKTLGIENSHIVDFTSFTLALSEVLSQAEERCKSSFSDLYIGFSPSFYFSKSHGMAALTRKEVLKQDLDLAIQTASAIPLPDKYICLHQRPDSFSVDSKEEIINPLGLSGLRLEVQLGLISVLKSFYQDITRAVKTLGYKPRAVFHNLISFGEHFTTQEQKQNGVCFCDIGHKRTQIISYQKNKIQNMFSLPLGGWHLTQALTKQFNISFSSAEELKQEHGQVLFNSHREEENIEYSKESIYFSRKIFSQCLEDVFENLLKQIKSQLTEETMAQLSGGFVFTGSSSYIKGFQAFADFYLGQASSHKKSFYKNFKQDQNLALLQQAHLENKLTKITKKQVRPLSLIRELF
ncbi:MAG: cell division protein FtsA [Bdellovibrionales bacterium]|nr:cell division protein FtsA [Bdellovibrionales bacterium]